MMKKMKIKYSNLILLFLCFIWIILCMALIYPYVFSDEVIVLSEKNPKNSYLATVIDYDPIPVHDYELYVETNLQRYTEIIQYVGGIGTDIVVFPECGLFSCIGNPRTVIEPVAVQVPSVKDSAIPYKDGKTDVLSVLSEAAMLNNLYLAVNLVEKVCTSENCTNPLLYNTDVVFDRIGKIIARYRKYNLYDERWTSGINQTSEVEHSVFTTDFNETFGVAICFDLIFKDPAVTLVKQMGVNSIIYSAAMQARLPFLAVSSLEAGWSYAMNVNLLASSLPTNISFGGSNIYFGRRNLPTYILEYKQSTIIIAEVPIKNSDCISSGEMSGLEPYTAYGKKQTVFIFEDVLYSVRTESLYNGPDLYSDSILQKSTFHTEKNGFHCDISMIWRNNSNRTLPNYKFLGYSGTTNYTGASVDNYVEMCGLVLCSPENTDYCGLPPQVEDSKEITVVSLNIVVISPYTKFVIIPITLDSNLLAFKSSKFTFNRYVIQTGEQTEVNVAEINLNEPTSDLVTMGIYTLPERSNPRSN